MDGKAIANGNGAVGQSGSQQQDGIRKPVGATLGAKGVIDPALARTTAGGTGPGLGSPGPAAGGNAPGPGALGSIGDIVAKRGRGRPRLNPVSEPKPTDNKAEAPRGVAVNINGVEKILFSIHTVVAAFTGIPELEIEEKEAKELSAAIAAVSAEYSFILDPKTAAWIELTRVCGVIYGPRAVSIWLRTQTEKKNTPQKQQTAQAPTQAPPDPPMPTTGFDPTKITIN
jgi:hypothetical protein